MMNDKQTLRQMRATRGGLPIPPPENTERILRLARRFLGVSGGLVSIQHEGEVVIAGRLDCPDIDQQTCAQLCRATHEEGVEVVHGVNAPDHALLPNVAVFAAVPLEHPDGTILGSFCVVDVTPRGFDEADRNMLRDLAAAVVDSVVMRRAIEEKLRAEEALRRRDAILEATQFAAQQFLYTAPWTTSIRQVLQRLGEAAGVSRVYLFENYADEHGALAARQRFEWAHATATPQHQNPDLQGLPYEAAGFGRWKQELEAGRVVHGLVHDFPEAEAAFLRAQDIESVVVVPIFTDRTWWGFAGFDDCVAARRFSPTEIGALSVAAGTLGAAIGRSRYEEQLIAAKEEAEAMNRLKTSLLANMSHEIRTPLTSIIGFADVLYEEIEGEQRSYLKLIRRSSHRLLDTLNSVLELAQLESGALRLHLAPVDLAHEAREVVQLLQPAATEKGLRLSCEGEGASLWADLDQGALTRVLNNLVSNAIKFTERGRVSVRCWGDAERVGLDVQDTGVGISAEFLPHLFDEFTQESSGLARDYEGNGLGLALCQQLVELMHGEISVDSQKGQGSRFCVVFPRRAAPADRKNNREAPSYERSESQRPLQP